MKAFGRVISLQYFQAWTKSEVMASFVLVELKNWSLLKDTDDSRPGLATQYSPISPNMKDPQKKTIQISRPHQACAPTWWAKLSRLHFGLVVCSFSLFGYCSSSLVHLLWLKLCLGSNWVIQADIMNWLELCHDIISSMYLVLISVYFDWNSEHSNLIYFLHKDHKRFWTCSHNL